MARRIYTQKRHDEIVADAVAEAVAETKARHDQTLAKLAADHWEDRKTYHWVGYRDALANLTMLTRDKGANDAVLEFAQKLLEWDEKHPHALWVGKNMKSSKVEPPEYQI